MIRTIPRAVALAGALALGLTACGDATDPGSAPSPTTGATSTTDAADQTTTSQTTTSQTTSPDATTSGSTTSEDDMKTPRPVPVPTDGAGALPSGPVADAVLQRPDVQAAIAAEAERRGVPVDEVEVVGFAAVTWSNGSLGCPQPGMMYTMALVPGYQLILEVDGQKASYHAAKDKPFNYCASPVPPTGGGSSSR